MTSISAEIEHWVKREAGFPKKKFKTLSVNLHSNGSNVLTVQGASYIFDVIESARNISHYQDICLQNEYIDSNMSQSSLWNYTECPINAASRFWNHSRESFDALVDTDEDVQEEMSQFLYPDGGKEMSQFLYPDGSIANRYSIIGKPDPSPSIETFHDLFELVQSFLASDNSTVSLESSIEEDNPFVEAVRQKYTLETGECYLITLWIPWKKGTYSVVREIESEFVERILQLKENMETDPLNTDGYTVSVTVTSAYDSELMRGLLDSFYLAIIAFGIMVLFCTCILSKPSDKVRSQSLLGIGAVCGVILSVATGYGIMFIFGVPLTTLSAMLPYILLGIGLDDTFIITGCLDRTDPNNDFVVRVEEAMNEAGSSITVSSITTIVAYVFGSIFSSMPGIKWFCIYAFTMIFINYVFQFTYFIAICSIDDRRVKANRYDCCLCIKRELKSQEETTQPTDERSEKNELSLSTRFMDKYADILLKPFSKLFVIVSFSTLLGLGIFYANKIETKIDFLDLYPEDSYLKEYVDAVEQYANVSGFASNDAYFYFRDEDFGDPGVQEQMQQYVDEIVDMPFVSNPPLTFWPRDFQSFVKVQTNESLLNATFNEQLDVFLETSPYKELYSNDIIRDENGTMTLSRAHFTYDQVTYGDSESQTKAFLTQKAITENQEINDGSAFASFFNHSQYNFLIWQTWGILMKEIVTTLILGLICVFFVSMIFVKQLIGAFILTGVVTAVYFELVAVYYLTGLSINHLTSMGLITCLGLVVDFSIHICLAYFRVDVESDSGLSKNERVKRVLMTMGESVSHGAITTFLG
eukprot:CAMPEP_0178975586 /NCGR_PEP_ID=MMETSP0789-20121207/23259_1 /TAXON_ID=3005 /ORGANISM="Rhizosolenia setigera, Strain CCMP 1694" /LENGTH=811 /DNA_ID=CAMNT_0020664377 /DNA_START=229 /DNA_END=2661 /DNA_ORIENTATION=-